MEAVTTVICTRNRADGARAAAESVLASRHDNFKLVLVDQSTDDATERALGPLRRDPRLVYLRTSTVGLSRARNIGLRTATTKVVVFTDDDCEVPGSYLATMQQVFEDFPKVAVAFCTVKAGPHNAAEGFIPAYECHGTRVFRRIIGKIAARGIGAGFAVRRHEMLDLMGGFDEALGAGGVFSSCEDGDAAARALLAGFELCETDRTFVVHHGFRTWLEGRSLGRRDWFGIGAAFAKPLRVGRWDFSPVPLYEFWVKSVGAPLGDLVMLRRPRGWARSYHFLRGFARGCTAPLDREKVVFIVSDT